MKKGYQKDKTLARGRYVYIGVDVHKGNWHVAVRVEGEEVFHGSMASEYHSLRKLLDPLNKYRAIFPVVLPRGSGRMP